MDEPWIVITVAVITALFGAPVMSAIGTWMQARFGLLKTQTEQESDIAKLVRDQEYRDRMAFREEQQRELTSLRLQLRTLKEAFDALEEKCSALERQHRDLTARGEAQHNEIVRLELENTTLKARVTELERVNYGLYRQVDQLKKGQTS